VSLALPRANRVRVALLEKLPAHRFGGKIMVAFQDLGVIGLGDDFPIPNGFDHGDSPIVIPHLSIAFNSAPPHGAAASKARSKSGASQTLATAVQSQQSYHCHRDSICEREGPVRNMTPASTSANVNGARPKRLDSLGDPFFQLAFRRGADLRGGHLAVLEQHERRYAADAVSSSHAGVFIDV
jgi:hypothetical protein